MPARTRRFFEEDCVIRLAGGTCEHFYGPPMTGYGIEPAIDPHVEASVAELVCRPQPLAFAAEEGSTDESVTRGTVAVLAQMEATRMLSLLRAVTAQFVVHHRFGRLVRALVPELLATDYLSGPDVRRILRAADRSYEMALANAHQRSKLVDCARARK